MLALTGQEHFYFILGCTDMRYGYRITYRTKDGKAETRYFPMAEDKQAHVYNEVVPGTHATANYRD